MTLIRFLANAILLSAFALRRVLYAITRTLGHGFAVIPIGFLGALCMDQMGAAAFYLPIVVFIVCRFSYPVLKPTRPLRLWRRPARPPPPLPKAAAFAGRTDDPDEATVVGRLDPKLRSLLQQKADPSS